MLRGSPGSDVRSAVCADDDAQRARYRPRHPNEGDRVSRLRVTDLPIAGLKLVERFHLSDERGCFSSLYDRDELALAGWIGSVVQVNHSHTPLRGTVRGLHYQRPPKAEIKLASCLRGEVWDVVVDIRRGSPTFLRAHVECLSAENRRALLVPEGCAHGWQSLTNEVDMLYCHSAAYDAGAAAGLNPHDPLLAIQWPLPVSMISDRDSGFALISAGFTGWSP